MNLAAIRIITTRVRPLVEFYEYVTGRQFMLMMWMNGIGS